jgi:hypothetical protein
VVNIVLSQNGAQTNHGLTIIHKSCHDLNLGGVITLPWGAFTYNVKSMLSENLGGILGGT